MTLRRWLIAALMLAAPSARGEPAADAEQCQRALREAKGKESIEEARASERCGDGEVKLERHLEAAKYYARAARAARSDLRLRKKLLFLRKREAERAKAESSIELAKLVLEADRTLEQVTRRPRRQEDTLEATLSSLADAAQTYRRDRDTERAEEALALRALVLVRSQKADDGLRAADRVVARPNLPKYAAIVAHEARTWALLERGDAEAAASAAILYNHLRNPNGRSALLDRACHLYEKEQGAGRCTRLEMRLTGEATFTDFSLARRKKELTEADIEKVHVQALPVLEGCVLSAAKKEPEFYRNVDIELSWAIDAEGRAIDIELTPKRNQPDIMPCAQGTLLKLRYPKVYSKERKNVMIPYHLD